MSSAAIAYRAPAPIPLHQEGLVFWEDLVRECEQHAQTINNLAAEHGLDAAHWVESKSARNSFSVIRKLYPSTEINANLSFEHWGPTIKVSITGQQHEDLRYYPEEHEVLLARDLDDRTVAVLGEGRSYSPQEFASYLGQHLRRCFPELALPCALEQ
jgi:hypothetical protein